jgi:mRNA interferase RelE/StbE
MTYVIRYRPGLVKDVSRLPGNVLKRIDKTITELAAQPRPHGCLKLAAREGEYRVRVGDYRIVYVIDDPRREVEIRFIAHRREVYRE